MIGGETTAPVVLPLSKSLKFPEVTVAFLTIESVANSILSIVLFFAFVGIYTTGSANWLITTFTIASEFSIGIALGAILSLEWVYLLYRFQKQKFTYVLTLGLVFVTYSVTARLGGSGELAVLIFGIILGNYYLVNRLIRSHINIDALQKQLGTFQEEISFLMETLFFVILGLTFVITPSLIIENLIIGLIMLVVLITIRVVATSISTFKSELSKEKQEIVLMCAQGLVPATLAILAVNLQIPLAGTFINLVTYVIILTNIVTAVGSILKRRRQKQSFRDFMQSLDESLLHGYS